MVKDSKVCIGCVYTKKILRGEWVFSRCTHPNPTHNYDFDVCESYLEDSPMGILAKRFKDMENKSLWQRIKQSLTG